MQNNSIQLNLNEKNIKHKKQRVSLIIFPIVLLIFMSVINKFQFGVSLTGVIIPIVMYVCFFIVEKKNITLSISHLICLMFWFFSTISTLISEIVTPQRDNITFLIFTLFFILCTSVNYNKRELKVILHGYVFVAIFCSADIIFNFLNGFKYSWNRYSIYVFNTHRDPNYVSAFILFGLTIILLELIISKKMKITKKFNSLIMAMCIILGSLATGSRTSFMFTMIVLIISSIYYFYKRKVSIISIVTVILGLILITSILKNIVPVTILERLLNFENYSDDIRMTLWKSSFKVFEMNPLIGAGLGGLNKYLFSIGLFDSHNVYLDILCGQGLIGIILLILMIIQFIRVKKKDRFIMGMVIFSLFAPLSTINGFNTATFWLPMTLCQIMSNYSRKNEGGIYDAIKNM
ncbi:O-antigen ligase family protein [Bacillus sp. BAU-SS-2023]|nr:O-antigen ligase family protein [Bacillus sp. BAU-SS-2023]